MKEITILSLGGLVIALEVDARAAIQKYLDNSRAKLKKDEATDEIIEDLELAIATHLSEQGYSEKRAASKKIVDEVLRSMGEVDEAEAPVKPGDWRRFFDEPFHLSKSNKVIFGLCGAIAERLNIDAFWIRIAFIVVVLLGGSWLIWAYLIIGIVTSILDDKDTSEPPKVKHILQNATDKTTQAAKNSTRALGRIDSILRKVFRIIFAATAIGVLIASLAGLAVALVALFGRPEFDIPLVGTTRSALVTTFIVSGFGLLIWVAGGVLIASLSTKRKPIRNRGWQVVGALVPTVLLASTFAASSYYLRDHIVDWAEAHPGNRIIEVQKWQDGTTQHLCVSPLGSCNYPHSVKKVMEFAPDGTLIRETSH